MQNGTEEYEHRTARVLRGTEARAIAKWTAEGWDLESQQSGRLRTELVFRRPRSRGLASMLVSAASRAAGRFGALPPRGKVAVVGLAAVVLVGAGAGIGLAASREPAQATPVAMPTERVVTDTSPTVSPTDGGASIAKTAPTQPAEKAVLTAANSVDLRRLLRLKDVDSTVSDFAERYAGRTIEFDGAVLDVAPHGNYKTRFDFLIGAGDFSETESNGFSNFQFRDKNVADLSLRGDIPDAVSAGQNVHIVAKVASFNATQDLFLLDPVSTEFR